jgi:branched-chain amino acid transport system substrate-binding protein
MKTIFAAAMLLSATLALTAPPAVAQQRPVMLGAVQSLSGPNAPYGVAIRAGLELAAAEINAAGGVLGGRPLHLIVEDSAGDPGRAVRAARRLIDGYRVPLIVGPTLSTEMLSVGPLASQRRIPIVSSSNTAIGITDTGPYVFRTALPAVDVIPATLRAAQQRFGIERVAILYGTDDAFTRSEYDVIRSSVDRLGIETVATETFRSRDTDFSAQLNRIRALNPDAVVVSALLEAAGRILVQARELGIPPSVRFIGGDGFNSPELAAIAGAAADGILVGSPWFIGDDHPRNREFVAAYRAAYDRDPDQFAAQAYDTLHIVAAAIGLAGSTDGDALRTALMQIRHEGVVGPFWFSPTRDPGTAEGVVLLTMRDGRFTTALE